MVRSFRILTENILAKILNSYIFGKKKGRLILYSKTKPVNILDTFQCNMNSMGSLIIELHPVLWQTKKEITQLFCCTEKAIKALRKCAKRHKAAHRVNDRGKIWNRRSNFRTDTCFQEDGDHFLPCELKSTKKTSTSWNTPNELDCLFSVGCDF